MRASFFVSALLVTTALLASCGLPGRSALVPVAVRSSLETEGDVMAEATKAAYKAYYGISHTHVAENGDDGQGTLAEAYAFAKDRAKLDFLAISSHSHMITDQGYAAMKTAAKQVTQDGSFVAIVAQEWSSISKGGHINIMEANERCPLGNGAWNDFYTRWLPNHPEVAWVQFNHPHPSNPAEFGGSSFSPVENVKASIVAEDKVAGMALLNGPGKYVKPDMKGVPDDWDRGVNKLNYEVEYIDFLNRGWHIGALADQDNHVANWGLAVPTRTGVWARNLTKAGIIEAYRERRTFAAFDPNVKVWLSINGKDMGQTIAGTQELAVRVAASDPDTVIKRLELFADTDGVGGAPAKVVAKQEVGKKTALWKLNLPGVAADAVYFAKVVFDDRDAWAWTSPIWVNGLGGKKQSPKKKAEAINLPELGPDLGFGVFSH